MAGLLLVPYNDSMRLGQGYNSFLQEPCINGAVEFVDEQIVNERHAGSDVSQEVSYSSRYVSKLSDVVRSMNISAGSSVKSGTVQLSGSSLGLDEMKFTASDLNAVISVRVMNQTHKLLDRPVFKPMNEVSFNSHSFFEVYGDSFISGFIEGGDLHGIVSMKVMDATKKEETTATLKTLLNSQNAEFTLSTGSSGSKISSALSQTETTITVSWTGGGTIKDDNEEWSLDSLFRVAAAFPSCVAKCPKRVYAILTKYNDLRDFVRWSLPKGIKVYQFSNVLAYSSELLDMYMQYKHNILHLQDVLENMKAYEKSEEEGAIVVTVKAIIEERKKMRDQMQQIVQNIDAMNTNPSGPKPSTQTEIFPPELWATKLPVLRQDVGKSTTDSPAEFLRGMGFPIIEPKSKSESESEPAAEADVQAAKTTELEVAMKAREVEARKAAEELQKVAEEKAAEEAKKEQERKAAEEAALLARRVAEAKAAEEAAELKAIEDAKKAAALKAEEDAKKAAAQKAAEDAKKAADEAAQKAAKYPPRPPPDPSKFDKEEISFLTSDFVRYECAGLVFDPCVGASSGGSDFNTASRIIKGVSNKLLLPDNIWFRTVSRDNCKFIGLISLMYESFPPIRIGRDDEGIDPSWALVGRVRKSRAGRAVAFQYATASVSNRFGICGIRIKTQYGRTLDMGDVSSLGKEEFRAPQGMGLLGFWGRQSDGVIVRLGAIWMPS